jgi:hypothetical protein
MVQAWATRQGGWGSCTNPGGFGASVDRDFADETPATQNVERSTPNVERSKT